jgi:DNA (cytosine-5)-methyltransferase 1
LSPKLQKSSRFPEPEKPVGNVAELFAGVGGFRIGLARAGWITKYSNQWEPSTKSNQHASRVYVANFGEEGHDNFPIEDVKTLPDGIDLLVGGFPCQDYSVAKTLNSSKGLTGKKGVLWWEILRLIEAKPLSHRPTFVLLENVDRLLKSPSTQRGRDFAVMLKTLGDAGYIVEWRVVNAAEYGFPQRRIRVFIVATKKSSMPTITDVSGRLLREGVLARALPVENENADISQVDVSKSPDILTRDFNRVGGLSPFLNAGIYVDGVAHTAKVKARISSSTERKVLKDVLIPSVSVPPEYWVRGESLIKAWCDLKDSKSIPRVNKLTGISYNYTEGKMAFPDLLENPSRTILTGEGGSSPSRFKHIIEHDGELRRLTPIELERLNGFPDDWTKTDDRGVIISDSRRAFFMGNALVVGIVELIGKSLAEEYAALQKPAAKKPAAKKPAAKKPAAKKPAAKKPAAKKPAAKKPAAKKSR